MDSYIIRKLRYCVFNILPVFMWQQEIETYLASMFLTRWRGSCMLSGFKRVYCTQEIILMYSCYYKLLYYCGLKLHPMFSDMLNSNFQHKYYDMQKEYHNKL